MLKEDMLQAVYSDNRLEKAPVHFRDAGHRKRSPYEEQLHMLQFSWRKRYSKSTTSTDFFKS